MSRLETIADSVEFLECAERPFYSTGTALVPIGRLVNALNSPTVFAARYQLSCSSCDRQVR